MESNVQKMREALEAIRNLAYEVKDINNEEDVKTSLPAEWVIGTVNTALSLPPRNCDVGTAEEQEVRFKRFCESHWNLNKPDSECAGCPLERVGTECEFAWAQMDYEESEAER